jgi:VanZ family protein
MTRSRWIAPALWGALIETLTSWPAPPQAELPSGSDKAMHLALYAVFSFLVIRAACPGRPGVRALATTFVCLAVWAALDEWHQELIPGRDASVSDWIADSAGVVVGLAIGWAKPRRMVTA